MPNFGEQFLHQKDSKLHTSKAVEHEKKRKEIKGEETSQKPADKLADFMAILEHTHTGHRDDPRVAERIKASYHKEHVIKPEDVPESAFLLEQRIARELGHGDVEITDEFKERKIQQIISDQESSLDKWLEYLSSEDAQYPTWAKYWAFRSMLEMGKFQKEEDEDGKESARFQKRTKDTVASFPPLNPRALAMTIGVLKSKIEEQSKPKKDRAKVINTSTKLSDPEFQELLSSENFAKIYAQFLIEMPEYSTEKLQETRGQWVKYEKGSDPKELVDSLDGYPLEWCTANIDTARTQLEGGDFYVYYSINEAGDPVIPRLAIRMQDNQIGEVRGIAPDQNIDPYIADVAATKLAEFPDGKAYEQKSTDMKKLTEIDNKTKAGETLTKEELIFLYEIDHAIQCFGYQRDPRIAEILQTRNPKEDAPIVFDCESSEIAWGVKEVDENTKAYIGPWNIDIFQVIKNYPNITHLYESFSDKNIFLQTLETDPSINSPAKAEQALKDKNIYLSNWGKDVLKKTEFSQTPEVYNLVRFTVEQLGLKTGANTDQIYKRARELALEQCPAEVGPQLRLKYTGGEWFLIAMKQISDRNGNPDVFDLRSAGDLLELVGNNARPDDLWFANYGFVFRFRK